MPYRYYILLLFSKFIIKLYNANKFFLFYNFSSSCSLALYSTTMGHIKSQENIMYRVLCIVCTNEFVCEGRFLNSSSVDTYILMYIRIHTAQHTVYGCMKNDCYHLIKLLLLLVTQEWKMDEFIGKMEIHNIILCTSI